MKVDNKNPTSIDEAKEELNSYVFEETLCKQFEEEKLTDKALEAHMRMKGIEDKINSIQDPYRCVLYLHYILKKPLSYIAKKINYCETHTKRIIKKAQLLYAKIK